MPARYERLGQCAVKLKHGRAIELEKVRQTAHRQNTTGFNTGTKVFWWPVGTDPLWFRSEFLNARSQSVAGSDDRH